MNQSRQVLAWGEFELDLLRHELRRGARRVRLQEQPYQVLVALLERPGEIVSRAELRSRLWPEATYVEYEKSINVAVVKLRRALGDAAEEPRYIETLPKLGYRFLSPVADRSMAASPEVVERDRLRAMASAVRAWEWQPASTEKILDHKREYRPARALRRALLGVTILVAAAAVILGLWLHGSASRPEIRSLAVLPFDSGPTTAGQSLAARTTQELVASLTRIRVLEVVTPAPSEPGLAGALAPLEVRRLGVDAVVEGSVESVGSHVRVSLRLLHAASSRQLWAARYEREEKDLTGLENEIARDLARELEARVTRPKY